MTSSLLQALVCPVCTQPLSCRVFVKDEAAGSIESLETGEHAFEAYLKLPSFGKCVGQ